MNEKYDTVLMGILQNEGKLDKFLDVMFGFLMRRTDFYYIMSEDEKKLGFPPGIAEKMVMHTYKKHETIFTAYQKALNEKMTKKETGNLPHIGETVEVSTSVNESAQQPSPQNVGESCEETKGLGTKEQETKQQDTKEKKTKQQETNVQETKQQDTKQQEASNKQVPGSKEEENARENYVADPDCYNGAVHDNYSWSQTIGDLDIRVKVPDDVMRGRDVRVSTEQKHLSVRVSRGGVWETILEGDLTWEIKKAETIWSLVPKDHQVHITLDKVQERWWESVFPGERKINTRSIDCSRPVDDLDEEAQAKIQHLMFDQEQKRLGLPTSKEQKMQNLLKSGWDKEGSPFAGQTFDPSKINFGADGSCNIQTD